MFRIKEVEQKIERADEVVRRHPDHIAADRPRKGVPWGSIPVKNIVQVCKKGAVLPVHVPDQKGVVTERIDTQDCHEDEHDRYWKHEG